VQDKLLAFFEATQAEV
jgi:chromosome segregation ATPase